MGHRPFFLTPSKFVQLDGHTDTPTSSCTSPPGDNGPELEPEPGPEPGPDPGPEPGPESERGPEPEPNWCGCGWCGDDSIGLISDSGSLCNNCGFDNDYTNYD